MGAEIIDGHRETIETLWIRKHSNPKQMNTGDDQ
jgi:hypothetical protein